MQTRTRCQKEIRVTSVTYICAFIICFMIWRQPSWLCDFRPSHLKTSYWLNEIGGLCIFASEEAWHHFLKETHNFSWNRSDKSRTSIGLSKAQLSILFFSLWLLRLSYSKHSEVVGWCLMTLFQPPLNTQKTWSFLRLPLLGKVLNPWSIKEGHLHADEYGWPSGTLPFVSPFINEKGKLNQNCQLYILREEV